MPPLYGLMAEFDDPKAVVEAAEAARMAGYRRMDAYSPYPIEALSEALALPKSHVSKICLTGGVLGLLGGYGLQYWSSVIEYPLNIAGRPFHSWVAFIPPAYETTIFCAAFSAVLGMLALNGLPLPYHPVFNVPAFARASRDRFFLCIEAADPQFDVAKTRAFLAAQPGVGEVAEVQP